MIFIGAVNQQIITRDKLNNFKGHSHPDQYEIIITVHGVVGVKVDNGEDFFVREGEVLFLPKSGFHWMWAAAPETVYYNSYFDGDLPLLNSLCSADHCYSLDGWSEMPFWQDCLPEEEETVMVKTLGLISFCARERTVKRKSTGDSFPSLEDAFRKTLAELIDSEPEKNHRLADIAGKFFLEPHYLSAKVKRSTGKNLMELYYQEKIDRAVSMLRKGQSVKQTAICLGFSNPYHFSRKYKQITGHSPVRDIRQ